MNKRIGYALAFYTFLALNYFHGQSNKSLAQTSINRILSTQPTYPHPNLLAESKKIQPPIKTNPSEPTLG